MANLTRGITYSVTETITNSKLHSLVDDATIANIVNGDIDSNAGIGNGKLADIIDAGKVSGTAIRNLPSLPSSAGLIPYINIPSQSLASIPNSALIPLSLASWVSGQSFKDLASTPTTIGTFPFQTIVPSLASGSLPVHVGGVALVGKTPAELGLSLGSWSTKTIDTVYQASTDGFVVFYGSIESGDQIVLYTDSSNPPTTVRQQLTSNFAGTFRGCMTCPVRKNDYYKVTTIAGSASPYEMFFIPLGV